MSKEKTRKSKPKSPNVLYIALILVAIALFLWVYTRNKSTTPYPYKTWRLGDVIEDEKLVFKADGITEDDMGAPGFWAPAKDEKFLLINMSFKNLTGEIYHLSPISYMKLVDNENHEYQVSSGPRITKGLGGPVNNGDTMSGQVGFLVKKSARGLKLVYDPHILNENIITVSLPD